MASWMHGHGSKQFLVAGLLGFMYQSKYLVLCTVQKLAPILASLNSRDAALRVFTKDLCLQSFPLKWNVLRGCFTLQ